MSTDLALYDRINDPVAAMKSLGLSIAQSGIFGTSNNAQGEVLALECMARRMPPLMLAEQYNIIHNRLSKKAEAMLSAFDEVGSHEMIDRTPDKATIDLTLAGKTKRFTLTWDECLKEPFVYEGKEADTIKRLISGGSGLVLKPKYTTPRSRMQMLWARVVSDSIVAIWPKAKNGAYTPEEIDDFEDEPATNGNGHAKTATKKPAATVTAPDPNAGAIDVPFEVKVAPGQPVTTNVAAPKVDAGTKLRIQQLLRELNIEPGWDVDMLSPDAATRNLKQLEDERMARLHAGSQNVAATQAAVAPAGDACSAEQSNRVKELWGLLNATPEQREKMLTARSAKTVRNLTATQATELIGKLEAKLDSIQPGAATSTSDPCGPETAARIKTRLAEVEQTAPGTVAKFRTMMARGGVPKIENLSVKDAAVLLGALTGNGLEAFFGMTVAQWPTPADPATVGLSDGDAASKN